MSRLAAPRLAPRLEVPIIEPLALTLGDPRGARLLAVDDVADSGETLPLVAATI